LLYKLYNRDAMKQNTQTLTPKRILDTFELSNKTRRQMAALKRLTGWTKKTIVETAVNQLHTSKN